MEIININSKYKDYELFQSLIVRDDVYVFDSNSIFKVKKFKDFDKRYMINLVNCNTRTAHKWYTDDLFQELTAQTLFLGVEV